MARCNACNKFVSLEAQDPEFDQVLEIMDDSLVGEVSLVLACEECGEPVMDEVY